MGPTPCVMCGKPIYEDPYGTWLHYGARLWCPDKGASVATPPEEKK